MSVIAFVCVLNISVNNFRQQEFNFRIQWNLLERKYFIIYWNSLFYINNFLYEYSYSIFDDFIMRYSTASKISISNEFSYENNKNICMNVYFIWSYFWVLTKFWLSLYKKYYNIFVSEYKLKKEFYYWF